MCPPYHPPTPPHPSFGFFPDASPSPFLRFPTPNAAHTHTDAGVALFLSIDSLSEDQRERERGAARQKSSRLSLSLSLSVAVYFDIQIDIVDATLDALGLLYVDPIGPRLQLSIRRYQKK